MKNSDYWFVFQKNNLLLSRRTGDIEILQEPDIHAYGIEIHQCVPIGAFGGRPCFAGTVSEDFRPGPGVTFQHPRTLFGFLPDDLYHLAGKAFQILSWDMVTRFCGKCGKPMMFTKDASHKTCSACSHILYPLIKPAVIVAVTCGNKILLARPKRIKQALYSVIAGYVEIGESLEDAVRREVLEETGIEIDSIRYFGSQSWPYSASLMIAFTAEYSGGDIVVEASEIEDAGWFDADALPPFPAAGSISHLLITQFVEAAI
jgi:NAD+ diphosphatase